MKNAILIHGTCDKEEYFDDSFPSLSNSHWFPWLQKQLLINNIFTQTPEMPEAYMPNYGKWLSEFKKFEINQDSILIGHSCGAGFLLRYLSENDITINKLILVAPWLDPGREKTTDFFDFDINQGISKRIKEIHLLYSLDDDNDILKSVKIIENNLKNMKIHKFSNYGHFTFGHMKTDKFPELLDIIKKIWNFQNLNK